MEMPAGSFHIDGMEKKPKRPRDVNQLAKYIVELATTNPPSLPGPSEMAERGRSGGLIGGKARAKSLDASERSAIAKRAANARWSRSSDKS
jgi:hypothetical protein